jgi:1-aminocyclopropane-1-carboxylate deaminase/D-cysteine desulfhydrase-like pyridoxal-dependent ACC family enzyme
MTLPLFIKYPALEKRLPWISLANWPTPVQKLENLGNAIGYPNIWIKRDDQSSECYGGNKVRKLEFMLADARKKGFKWIVTYGGVGTNHGLATTIHAQRLGLRTALVLIPQPLTDHVQENLLLDRHFGAEIHYASSTFMAGIQTAGVYLKHGMAYFVPPGGSSTLGSLGYVNAALELKQQIDAGLLPEPEYIFCALGSKGTMAGLLLGTRLAGMKTRVVGVRVAMEWLTSVKNTAGLASRMSGKLHRLDKNIPLVKFKPDDIHVISDFFGGEYGRVTPEGQAALAFMWETEKIKLELTYTAKTVAAMLDFIQRHPELKNAPVLYWHTYNAVDFTGVLLEDHDHTRLPADVQWCFRENLIPCLCAGREDEKEEQHVG